MQEKSLILVEVFAARGAHGPKLTARRYDGKPMLVKGCYFSGNRGKEMASEVLKGQLDSALGAGGYELVEDCTMPDCVIACEPESIGANSSPSRDARKAKAARCLIKLSLLRDVSSGWEWCNPITGAVEVQVTTGQLFKIGNLPIPE